MKALFLFIFIGLLSTALHAQNSFVKDSFKIEYASQTLKVKATTAAFVNIIIVDVEGYVVYDNDFENPTGSFDKIINVQQLPAGNYVLKLFSGKDAFSEKFTKP